MNSLQLICAILLLVPMSISEDEQEAEKLAEEDFLQHVGNETPVSWLAARKLKPEGCDQFCQNISARMGWYREVSSFDDARVEGGILRFVYRKRNELIIDVLMCRTKRQNEPSSSSPDYDEENAAAAALPAFYVARGRHPKCVTHLKQFVPTMKIFAVIKQICNVTMPPKSERTLG